MASQKNHKLGLLIYNAFDFEANLLHTPKQFKFNKIAVVIRGFYTKFCFVIFLENENLKVFVTKCLQLHNIYNNNEAGDSEF